MPEDLERLGPTGFQDMASALATATIGAGVQVMGPGRDGGRDMYYRGRLIWSEGDEWDGYTVFQVKHKATLSDRPEQNMAWLWGQIKGELDAWGDRQKSRGDVPDYLLVITNVPLTPTEGSGGHDQILLNIRQYIDKLADDSRDASLDDRDRRRARHRRLKKLRGWRVWDRHQIQALLAGNGSVRTAFPAFLTAGDIFAHVAASSDWVALHDVEPVLRQQARGSLTGDGQLYFDEAGGAPGTGLPIHKVAIDLPITLADGSTRTTAMKHILQRTEHMLKPGVSTFQGPRHLVLTGAAGNGKTTLSKFVLQVFRSALLQEAEALSAGQREVIQGVIAGLARMGCALPNHRRWAVRIDLADYAEQGGLDHEDVLQRWISEKVSDRSYGKISPALLQAWMIRWPSVVILDGLDEVTEPLLRNRLLSQIQEFAEEAEALKLDCLIILTTRPVGYTEHIAPHLFEQVDMDFMSLEEAAKYGELVSSVRLRRDKERLGRLIPRFREAVADPSLTNLLRTPLQVLIITIIIEHAGSLAPDRYSLFWGYYQTVFARERGKQGTIFHLLSDHAQHILRLHERVGLRLQILSESADRSYAVLREQELRDEIWLVLDEAGYAPDGKDAGLLEKMFLAATHRLVLIAPRGDEGYGFDVRSLQELMAARRLTTGRSESIYTRLRTAAASPHWRNVLLFAAGRVFTSPQEHEREELVSFVENLDVQSSNRLGAIFRLGPQIALEMVDDGMLRSYPKWRTRLMSTGLHILGGVYTSDTRQIARILARYIGLGPSERREVREAFQTYSLSSSLGALNVARLRLLVMPISGPGGAAPTAGGSVKPGIDEADSSNEDLRQAWENFTLEIATTTYSNTEVEDLVAKAIEELTQPGLDSSLELPSTSHTQRALAHPEAARIIEAALLHLCPMDAALTRVLKFSVIPAVYRAPIGANLASRQDDH